MSVSTNTKIQQSNIFNPSDYIDDDYISRSEADIRFLNQNVAYEKMFGSLDITGDSTMTNQLVTGNSVINGSLTADTINGGTALNQGKYSTIKGNVTLGDTGWGTQVTLNGQVQVGTNTLDVKIKGATTEINKDSAGGNITIGNGVNTLTVNGALSVNSGSNNISMNANTIGLNSSGTSATTCNIGQVNNTTNLNGTVNIGSSTKETSINASNISLAGSTIGLNSSGTSATTCNIGQVNNTTNLNGTVNIGSSTKETSINASNISLAGSTIGLNSLGTAVTTCNIGKENNNTTNIPGVVIIGSNTKDSSISGSNVNINTSASSGVTTIGNGTSLIDLNSINVDIGNDNINSVTEIKGRTIAIGNNSLTGGIQIGRGSLTADAVGAQTNTFVSSVNKIFNPKLCDAWGNIVPTRNFNLNNPSFFVYSHNTIRQNNLYVSPPCGTVTNVVFYLYTPSLIETYTYAFSFEFYYYMMTGRINTSTSPWTLTASNSAKVINSSFSLLLHKASGDTAYTFKPYTLYENISPFNSYSSSSTSGSFPGMDGSCIPLGFAKASDGRIAITIQFPKMVQIGAVSTADFVCSRGASLRLCSSSITSGLQQVYPNNAMDSFGGTSYFQLS